MNYICLIRGMTLKNFSNTCNCLSYFNLIGQLEGDIFLYCPLARAYSNAEVI